MSRIPVDKAFHFLAGWAIAATAWPLLVWLAWVPALLAGIGKELWDKQGHGTPEVADAAVTALGGLTAAFLMSGVAQLLGHA